MLIKHKEVGNALQMVDANKIYRTDVQEYGICPSPRKNGYEPL
jgi:hypothetical protein